LVVVVVVVVARTDLHERPEAHQIVVERDGDPSVREEDRPLLLDRCFRRRPPIVLVHVLVLVLGLVLIPVVDACSYVFEGRGRDIKAPCGHDVREQVLAAFLLLHRGEGALHRAERAVRLGDGHHVRRDALERDCHVRAQRRARDCEAVQSVWRVDVVGLVVEVAGLEVEALVPRTHQVVALVLVLVLTVAGVVPFRRQTCPR